MLERQKKSFVVLSILFVLAVLSYLPFVYQGTLGEWDSYRMANGIIDSVKNYGILESPFLRNINISYGYYMLLWLFKCIFKTNLTLLISLMNYVNSFSAILMVIPVFFVVKRYWGMTTAILANILLIFVPSWWNISLYGHPMMQAMLFVFVGLSLIGYRSQLASLKASHWKLIELDLLIVVILSLSLTFRLDAMIMFILIAALLILERYSFKMVVLRSTLYGFLPVIIFYAAWSITLSKGMHVSYTAPTKAHVFWRLRAIFLYWHNPFPGLPRAMAICGLACHPLYLLVFCISCLYLVYRKKYLTLFFILPFIVVNLLFWIPNPSARHFVYMAPVLAIGIATLLSDVPWRLTSLAKYSRILTPISIVVLFVFASFIIGELIYPIVRANYPWKSSPQNYSVHPCIRSIFINKYYSEKYFRDVSRFGRDLQKLEPKDKPIFVIADGLPVTLQLLIFSENIVVKYQQLNNDFQSCAYLAENENNSFIIWREGDLMKLLQVSDEYKDNYLAIDQYHPNTTIIDTALLVETFDILPISKLSSRASKLQRVEGIIQKRDIVQQ